MGDFFGYVLPFLLVQRPMEHRTTPFGGVRVDGLQYVSRSPLGTKQDVRGIHVPYDAPEHAFGKLRRKEHKVLESLRPLKWPKVSLAGLLPGS